MGTDGTELVQLTDEPGYDAEATIGPNGRIVFTSVRDGDMEIYSMDGDGGDVRRLTNRQGPDGGPFFSALWGGCHFCMNSGVPPLYCCGVPHSFTAPHI